MTRRRFLMFVLALVSLLSAGAATADEGWSYLGKTNLASPTYHRTSEGDPPSQLSTTGTAVRFDAQRFRVNDAGHGDTTRCYIRSVQNYDGFLALYEGSFDPASPLANIVSASDDAALALGSGRIPAAPDSPILDLRTETDYVLVTSGFENDDLGEFQNTIHCDSSFSQTHSDAPLLHGTCTVQPERTCLQKDRFRTYVEFKLPGDENYRDGRPVPFGSADTAMFWFFGPENWELAVKVLDGCGVNNRFWVFYAALTDVHFRLTVHDTLSGAIKTYENPQGTVARPVQDTSAFATCP